MFGKRFETLVLRDELLTHWRNKDVFNEVQTLQGDIARSVPGRQTIRFELEGQVYYRKLHTGVGWGEILKSLVRLRLPIIGAANEWLALNRLKELGVPSLYPIAFGKKNINPARQLSFIVTRELKGTAELDHYLRTQPISFSERCALIAEVARIAKTIHVHGINHRDLYLCHFLLDLNSMESGQREKNTPLLYLVDLHRAQMRTRVPQRWLVKDVASIYFSSMDFKFTRRDVYRFLKMYFEDSLRSIFIRHGSLLQKIEQRARQLYEREQRLKARGLRD